MTGFVKTGSNAGDAITGERIFPGDTVFDTGIRNRPSPFMRNGRNRMLKEATIVWLAEQAGYDVVKRNAGNSGNAKVVDGEDASIGGGEDPVGEAPTGGKPAAKRRAAGSTKSK
jgi:hypothetical protein